MANICRCDMCGEDGGRNFTGSWDKPGAAQNPGERFNLDLCVECADKALNMLRATMKKLQVAMFAAQVPRL